MSRNQHRPELATLGPGQLDDEFLGAAVVEELPYMRGDTTEELQQTFLRVPAVLTEHTQRAENVAEANDRDPDRDPKANLGGGAPT